MRWSVVVPVKRLARAKTRLRGALTDVDHDALVLAMARDTVAAALACPAVAGVVVVTDDPRAACALAECGARIVPDRPAAGLNPAVEYGAAVVRRGEPGCPVAALGSDLPALRPRELTAALDACGTYFGAGEGRAFVADAAGSGTTLLAAAPGHGLDPRYGPDSAVEHRRFGARALDGAWLSLRRDVDTAADLVDAVRLGVGEYTRALCERAGDVSAPTGERNCQHSDGE